MKTKKKVLLALLSVSCVAAGAFGLAACGGGDDRDASIVNVYNQYVAYAESNGETPMTYDVWLNSIKGQKGDQGAPGADGKSAYELYRENFLKNNPGGTPMSEAAWIASLTGKNGKGVAKIELNESQTKLVVTYSDGSTEEVDLPEALVHVHDYGSEYVTVLAPTETTDGLGYLTCEDCGHNELLVIKPYEVTVLLADGKTPAANASVTLNGVTVTTGANGVAKFKDLKLGEYEVNVTKSGYAYVDNIKTSITEHEYKVILAEELNAYADFGNDLTPGSEVGDKKWFHLSAEYSESWFSDGWTIFDAYLEGESVGYSKFKLTFNEEYGDLIYWEGAAQKLREDVEDDGVVEFIVGPGETLNFQLTVNIGLWEDIYDYAFTVERATPPKDGEKDAPISVTLEEEVTYTAEANEEVYFKLPTENGKLYGFKLGEGVTLTALGGDRNSDGTLITSGDLTVESNSVVYYVKAKAVDGNISFKMKRVYREGEQGNPKVLTLGAVESAKVDLTQNIRNVWFKYTVTEEKLYTFEVKSGYYDYAIYKGENPLNAELVKDGVYSKMYINTLSEGTYYFVMNTECTCVLKEFDASTDGGYVKEYPKEITDGTLELSETTDMYFKYVVPKAGVFVMSAPIVDGSYVSNFAVYSDSNFSTRLFRYYDSNKSVEVTEGQILYFTASAGYAGDTHTVTFGTYGVNDEVENVLIVKDDDGNVLAGVTVTLYETNESGAKVVKGTETTDADGKVSFNLVASDKYTVTLDLGDNASDYAPFTNVKLEKTFIPVEFNLTVKKVREFTFNVKIGSEAADAGITVTYGSYTAVTNENGIAILKMPNPENYYANTLKVSNIPEGYEFKSNFNLSKDVYAYEIVLTAKPVELTISGYPATFEVKAGVAYKFTIDAVSATTISVSNGHIVSLTSNNIIINGTNVLGSSLQSDPAPEDDGVGYTSLAYWPYGSETLTVVFSEDATLTVSQ